MIQFSIFREINIPIKIPVKKSAPSCHDEEACSRVRHDFIQIFPGITEGNTVYLGGNTYKR